MATSASSIYRQIGYHLPGETAAITRRLNSIGFMLNPDESWSSTRPDGMHFDTDSVLDRLSTKGSYTGKIDANDLVFVAANVYGNPVTEMLAPGVYQHTFYAKSRGSDEYYLLDIEQGDGENRSERALNCRLTSMQLEIAKGDGTNTVSGDLFGGEYETGMGMTDDDDIVELEARTISASAFNHYADYTYGALGTTQLQRVFHYTSNLGDRAEQVYHNKRTPYGTADDNVDGTTSATVTLNVEDNTEADALATQLLAGRTAFVRTEGVGGYISGTSYQYKVTQDVAVKRSGRGDFGAQGNARSYDINMAVVHSADWGQSNKLVVVCAVPSLDATPVTPVTP